MERLKLATELGNRKREGIMALYGIDFLQCFRDYIFFGNSLDSIILNPEKIYTVSDESLHLKSIIEHKPEIRCAENKRRGNTSLFDVHYFNAPDYCSHPIRIDVVLQRKTPPAQVNDLFGEKIDKYIDIEFFEYIPIEFDSKNFLLKELLNEYLTCSETTLDDIRELDDLLALQDLEKLHISIAQLKSGRLKLAYLGIGTNQPFGIAESKLQYGKNRFYRYSLIGDNPFIQTSKIITSRITLPDNLVIFPERTTDGTTFGMSATHGALIFERNSWKKASYGFDIQPIDLKSDCAKDPIQFLTQKTREFFPSFENYLHVKFDPLEFVNRYGYEKSVEFLYEKGVLGRGWQNKLNVASDLYIHSYENMLRLKPSCLLLAEWLKSGKFLEILKKA